MHEKFDKQTLNWQQNTLQKLTGAIYFLYQENHQVDRYCYIPI